MVKKEKTEEEAEDKTEEVEESASKETPGGSMGRGMSEETAEETVGQESEQATEQESEEDYKPKKRLIRRKKSKKEKEHPLASAIRLAVESGKVEFGSRKGLKNSILGKAKLFVLASNTPSNVKDDVLKYSKASETPVIQFEGNNMELGSICGKPFSVSLLSVYDVGASNLLEIAKHKK